VGVKTSAVSTISNLRMEDISPIVTIYVERCQTLMLKFYNLYHMMYVETRTMSYIRRRKSCLICYVASTLMTSGLPQQGEKNFQHCRPTVVRLAGIMLRARICWMFIRLLC